MLSLIDTDVMIDVSRLNADAAKDLDSVSDPAISIVTARPVRYRLARIDVSGDSH
jgi:hypothetical protein